MARSLNQTGTTQYLEHAAAVLNNMPLAIVAWARKHDATTRGYVCAMNYSVSNWYILGLWGEVGGDPFRFDAADAGVGRLASTSNGFTANTWHHLCAIAASATDRRAILDGDTANQGTNATSCTPSGMDHVAIGALHVGASFYSAFDGDVAEIAVIGLSGYAGATGSLKADAFVASYLATLAAGYSPVDVPGVVAYWPLGGDVYGNTDEDAVGTYDMTAYNSPTWTDHPPMIYPSVETDAGAVEQEVIAEIVQNQFVR